MKKIIRGRMFDTDTAKKLGEIEHRTRSDFEHFAEGLYITKSGKYFLCGSGGPKSHYATATSLNSWTGGDGLIPITKEQAQEWGEKHIPAQIYEEIFGKAKEA